MRHVAACGVGGQIEIDEKQEVPSSPPVMTEAKRTKYDMDAVCVNNIRTLSADVVQGAKSGHPGAPMGCAPVRRHFFS